MKSDYFDGYSIHLAEDDEGDFVAHFVEMPTISAFGESAFEALEELKTAWMGAKESYKNHGQPVPIAPSRREYSGHFNVRVDKTTHRALVMEAFDVGVSLNALVAQKLHDSVHR